MLGTHMRTPIFAVLLALLPLLYGCNNQEFEIRPIEINCTWIDSVSPMRVLLSTNQDLFFAEWVLNDSIYYGYDNTDSVLMILEKPGNNHIDLTATGVNNIHYQGTLKLVVPGAPSKLIIRGFYFKNNIKLPIDRDSVQVSLYLNDDIDNPEYKTDYSTSEFLGQDTIYFKKPIVFDVFGCYDIKDAKMSNLYFSVRDTPIYNFEDISAGYLDGTLTGLINKCYFKSNFDVLEAYRLRVAFPPHQLQMFGTLNPYQEARLFIEWK